MTDQQPPYVLRIASLLAEPHAAYDDELREAAIEAAGYLRSMYSEIEQLKAEGASYFESYKAMRAERDALIAGREPMSPEKRAAFGAAARPLIEFLNNLHPHHVAHVTSTGAELFEGQVSYNTNDFLKD